MALYLFRNSYLQGFFWEYATVEANFDEANAKSLFTQANFWKILENLPPPLRSRVPSFGPPAALANRPDLLVARARFRASMRVVHCVLRVDVRAGWWRQRRRQLQLRRCQTCKKCRNFLAKAQKVTKIIGVTLYMRSYGVEYYSRSSRMPHRKANL